jgi:hypothetical protein
MACANGRTALHRCSQGFSVWRGSSSASNDTSITRRRWAVMAKPWLRIHLWIWWRGEDTAHTGVLVAEGQAANLAVACGTWAPRDGEKAAEGLTARLRLRSAPLGEPTGKLAPGLQRSQLADLPGSGRRLTNHSRMFSGTGSRMLQNTPRICFQSVFWTVA